MSNHALRELYACQVDESAGLAEPEVLVEVIEIKPGERCPTCNRRRNKPRQKTTPEARKINAGLLPQERAEWLEEALDALQEVCGADPLSYPRGTLIEALAVLGGQHREELKELFGAE